MTQPRWFSSVQSDRLESAVSRRRYLLAAAFCALFLPVVAIAQAPSISSISPTSGYAATSVYAGTSVVINGTNFGSTQGTSSVTFNGTAGTPSTWSSTQIQVPVPSGATTGNVVVTVGGVASNGVAFTVLPPPVINSLNPTSGEPVATIIISGSGFGTTWRTVTLNGRSCSINSWSDTSISFSVPNGASSGNVVVVLTGGVQSNGVPFTVLAPTISSLSPTSGSPGASVTISGSYFEGGGTVKFNGQTASTTSWSDSSIVATVPTGATTGNVVVSAGGLQSNGVAFTVAPIITTISPLSGEPGASVTVTGKNFTTTTGTVKFNGTSATVSSWSNTSITVTAPNGVTSGNVVVTAGTLSSNGVWFGVLRPAIASVVPGAGNAGTSVTIAGNHFGSAAGSVTFNGQTASVSSWSDASVVVTVPSSATTGSVAVSNGGLQSNGVNFIVGPSISGYSPGTASAGTSVTITGVNFGSVIGGVTFNGLGASISSWTNGSITATVPTGATTGPVAVAVPGGSAVSGPIFVVPTVNGAFDQADVGTVSGAGSTSVNSGAYTVSAYSGKLGGTADSLHYLFQNTGSDFDMIAHATVVTSSDNVFQYGITVRDSLTTGSLSFSCVGQYNGGGAAAWRDTLNGAGTDSATGIGSSNPVWLRVRRYANIFVCYYSSNGTSWTQLQAAHVIGMGPIILTGLSVMSDNQTLAQVKFDNISITSQPGPPPSPWFQQDIGGANGSGDATYSSGVFNVASVASNFRTASSDSVHYIYQAATGDLDVITHVTWQQPYGTNAPVAGIMVRQSAASDDAQVTCGLAPGGGYLTGYQIYRAQPGTANQSPSFYSSYPNGIGPLWLRLKRQGSLFTCYTSTDGSTWTAQGLQTSVEVAMSSNVLVGLVESSNDGTLTLATFDSVSVNGIAALPGPWLQQDVGSVTAPGDATLSNGVFTVESNSYDITGTADSFHYVYQQAGGDLNIIASAKWTDYAGYSPKMGVMVRQSLDPADLQFSCLTDLSGYRYMVSRTTYGGADQSSSFSSVSSPVWLKINRHGSVFTCYGSADGITWTQLSTATVNMTANAYVGMAQTGYAGGYSLGTFSNVTLQANLPTVSITYPVAGSTVYLSQPVVLTATANPSPGATVSSVKYYEGQTLLGQAVSAPYSLNIGVPSKGSHTYTAQVTDSAGLQAVSVADTATMSNPQITSVSPTYGKAGTQIRVIGVGFGTSAAGVVLSVNGVPAQMTGFSNTEIDGIVPSGFDPGNGSGLGVGFPDGAGADGGPAFGPCPPNSICVTGLALSPTTVIADGTQSVAGTATMSGPPGLSGNVWAGTIYSPFWGNTFTCVSPATLGQGDMLLSACVSSTPSFSFTLGAPNTTGSLTTTVHVYYGCGLGGCVDPGVTDQVNVVGTGQAAGDPNQGPCTDCAEAGGPINIKTGNTYIQTNDYSLPGLGGGISITRTWNSRWKNTGPLVQAGMFGDSWRATYEDRIQTTSSGVNYWLDDGKVWRFPLNNGVYTLSSPVDAHATLTYDSVAQKYTLTFVNGTKKIFSSAGYLTQVVDRNGNAATLTYDGSNRLTQILDAGGRTLTFAYGDASNPNQVTSLTDAVGTIATYTYGTSSRLTNVTYADLSQINYTYDLNGLITSVTDAVGKVLESHTYDSQRRGLTSQRANGVEAVSVSYLQAGRSITLDSGGNSSNYNYSQMGEKAFIGSVSGPGCATCGIRGFNQYTYDSNGNVTASFDSNGVPTLYTYDANGNVTSRSTPVNNHLVTWNYTYNSFGELLTATDPLGNVTTNTYDANGNLLTSTTPAPDSQTPASVTTFTYDPKGQLLTIADPLNHVTTLAYYATGLLHTVTDAQNNVTTFNYDARGNRTDVYDAFTPSNHTSFEYDGRSRLTKIHNPDTSTVSFAYDTRGRRTSVTDGNGKITQYAYDDADRLTSVTDANNHVTQYGYDLESNLTSITDANLHTTSFTYDTQGRLTKTTFPSTKVETYSYDNVGNLMTKTDRKNQAISYAYDPLNRLTSKTYPDSTSVTYTYDDASRLTQVQDPTGTYSFLFDNMGRLKQTTSAYSFVSGNPFTVVYGYDKASNHTTMTDPSNGQTTYTYDMLNRLSNILDFNSNNFGFSYDALSRRTQLTRPNGINTNYSYDSVSNLLSVLHQQGVNTLDGATYTYDSTGNRTSKTNRLNGAVSNFSYDNAYQLGGVTGPNPESYTYDPVGNRLTSQSVPSYTYNGSNELTAAGSMSYTYDDNGNTRTKTDGTGSTTYNWDFENRLTSVQLPNSSIVNFKYDPFGRRIQKNGASTTNYVYDGSDVIEEVDASGNILARYTQGAAIDEPLSQLRSGTMSYYEEDGLGSVTSLSSIGGALVNSYVYDSFGNLTSTSGTVANPYQYTGRDYDPETGLRYYRARYYDAGTGRFLDEDPAGFDAGANFYPYVGNTPTGWEDPDGRRKVKVCRQPVESYRSKNHTYIAITDDDGKVLIDPVDHLQMTYGILGKKKGSKENQQVKKGDPRNNGNGCKDVTDCNEVKIDTLVDALETAWVLQACASCGKHYRGWFMTLHGIDGYNSNTYVFNMLYNAGMTPPHFDNGDNAPGYHKATGLWYPIPMD